MSFSYFRVKSGGIFNVSHMDISSLVWRHAASSKDRIHQPRAKHQPLHRILMLNSHKKDSGFGFQSLSMTDLSLDHTGYMKDYTYIIKNLGSFGYVQTKYIRSHKTNKVE